MGSLSRIMAAVLTVLACALIPWGVDPSGASAALNGRVAGDSDAPSPMVSQSALGTGLFGAPRAQSLAGSDELAESPERGEIDVPNMVDRGGEGPIDHTASGTDSRRASKSTSFPASEIATEATGAELSAAAGQQLSMSPVGSAERSAVGPAGSIEGSAPQSRDDEVLGATAVLDLVVDQAAPATPVPATTVPAPSATEAPAATVPAPWATPVAVPVPVRASTSPNYVARGEAQLALLPVHPSRIGFTISFSPNEGGFGGLMWPSRRHIDIFVSPAWSDAHLRHVIAHEIGHAYDLELNSYADRDRWKQARGIDAGRRWWADAFVTDFATPSGDFAECFAAWAARSSSTLSHFGSCDGTAELVSQLAAG